MKQLISISLLIIICSFYGKSQIIPELKPVNIVENLYAIENPQGGNIAFLVTQDGIVVVDAGSNPNNGKQILESIRYISDKPIKYLIFTHLHGDHVYGITSFPDDIKIIGHKNLPDNLKNITETNLKKSIESDLPNGISTIKAMIDTMSGSGSEEYQALVQQLNFYNDYLEQLKSVKIRYPDITFNTDYELILGNEKIILEFPDNGHTNDNIIVRFPKQNTVHTGDLIFNGMVPYVITSHGATVKGWVEILSRLSQDKFDHVIPGHGKITTSKAFNTQMNYFETLTQKVKELKDQGINLDEIKSKITISEFNLNDAGNQLPLNIEVIFNEL